VFNRLLHGPEDWTVLHSLELDQANAALSNLLARARGD